MIAVVSDPVPMSEALTYVFGVLFFVFLIGGFTAYLENRFPGRGR